MVDYDRGTGSAGTIRIRDLGYQVQFWLYCSDPATNSGALPWNGNVNGVDVGGTINWWAGRGEAMVAAYDVGYNQTVSFGIGATGTMGFGGPTSHSAYINRASVPGAPTNLRLEPNTRKHNSFGVRYDGAAANGAAIDQYRVHWRREDTGALVWEDMGSNGYTNPRGHGTDVGPGPLLIPGKRYRVGVQAHNSQGWGPWSVEYVGPTLPGVWLQDPDTGVWRVAIPHVPVDGQWRPCVPYVGIDGAWRETVN